MRPKVRGAPDGHLSSSLAPSEPICRQSMANAAFPWRPLGHLLVERGLIDKALAQQRREGRKLGEILILRTWVTPFGLAAALAAQHGVDLREDGDPPARGGDDAASGDAGGGGWKPLGRLLAEQGSISEVQLKQALAEQHASGARLGDI